MKATKRGRPAAPSEATSTPVRWAQSVRGGIDLVLGLSLAAALVIGPRGVVTVLDPTVDSLFLATAGKVLLAVIAVDFVVSGLKAMRRIR